LTENLVTAERPLATPEIRTGLFDAYPSAVGSKLDSLPSISPHCGVCDWRFTGGGQRNPFGIAVHESIKVYGQDHDGIVAAVLGNYDLDADGDGYTNGVEISDTIHWDNTPTFPGLHAGNLG
jgi:hypothetical protein